MKEDAQEKPSSRRRSLGTVLLFLLAVNAGVGIAIFALQPQATALDIGLAERFMRAIEVGNEDAEPSDKSGYEVAFDFLSSATQEKEGFPGFLFFFDEPIREFGFIQSWYRQKEEYGHFTDRRIRFEVEYGGLGDPSTVLVYELVLTPDGDSFNVAGYDLISTTKKE